MCAFCLCLCYSLVISLLQLHLGQPFVLDMQPLSSLTRLDARPSKHNHTSVTVWILPQSSARPGSNTKWPVTANACVGYKAAAGGSRTHGPSTYPADCCVQCMVLITFRLEVRAQEDCPCKKCENQCVARLFSHGYYKRANIIYRNLDCRYGYTAKLGKPKRARNKKTLAKLNGLASTQVNGNSSPTWGVQR